jgi:hypothetical protein
MGYVELARKCERIREVVRELRAVFDDMKFPPRVTKYLESFRSQFQTNPPDRAAAAADGRFEGRFKQFANFHASNGEEQVSKLKKVWREWVVKLRKWGILPPGDGPPPDQFALPLLPYLLPERD